MTQKEIKRVIEQMKWLRDNVSGTRGGKTYRHYFDLAIYALKKQQPATRGKAGMCSCRYYHCSVCDSDCIPKKYCPECGQRWEDIE